MKTMKFLSGLIIFFIFTFNLKPQDIQVIVHDSFKYEHFSVAEIILEFEIINISSQTQTVFEVRTVNNLPANWTSSLCFGLLCFPPDLDSIATAPPFPEPPLEPGDTLATSLHVFTDQLTIGTANVQIQVGTFKDPNNRVVLDFIATTDPTVSVEKTSDQPSDFFLDQNYPNPFNPSTKISFGIQKPGDVSLKVYDILGREVAELVNQFLPVGEYSFNFDAAELSSGIYFYKLSSNGFTMTRKMILQK